MPGLILRGERAGGLLRLRQLFSQPSHGAIEMMEIELVDAVDAIIVRSQALPTWVREYKDKRARLKAILVESIRIDASRARSTSRSLAACRSTAAAGGASGTSDARSTPALAGSLAWFGVGFGGIVMGRIADRVGVRWTVMFGALMICVGLEISSFGAPWQLYVGHATAA